MDFPCRLDQKYIDQNGNPKKSLADDVGVVGSEENVDEVESEDDEGPYEGAPIQRKMSRFLVEYGIAISLLKMRRMSATKTTR
ncbi:unnamed protein product [Peronospora farinosa]|nr:unnamed protein product [Peronospora farinosa]